MPDLTAQKFVTRNPGAYNYTLVGTAAGTTTISSEPCYFKGIVIPRWVSGATYTIFDSAGTSGTVIGTIVLGTSPLVNPPGLIEFNIATKNALTVVNVADQGAVVLYK